MKNYLIIGGVALLFLAFRKKITPKKYSTMILLPQSNAPAGAKQVYSQVGTEVFNLNGKVIFTFDFRGSGMTVTGEKLNYYNVVIGDNFMTGVSGYVLKNSVII